MVCLAVLFLHGNRYFSNILFRIGKIVVYYFFFFSTKTFITPCVCVSKSLMSPAAVNGQIVNAINNIIYNLTDRFFVSLYYYNVCGGN